MSLSLINVSIMASCAVFFFCTVLGVQHIGFQHCE